MSTLDFLWNGQPPPATTTYGTQITGIPQYLNDYTQGLLMKANAVAGEQYQLYNAPRIAPFSQDQRDAFQFTRDAAGAYQPGLNNGMNMVQQAGSMDPSGAAAPYLNSAFNMSGTGSAMPWMRQSAMYDPTQAAAGDFNRVGGMNVPGAADPMLDRAERYSATRSVSPLASQAGERWTENVGDYMSPYTDRVVKRIGELGERNMRENLLPAIRGSSIRSGQFGSSRMREAEGKALRDTQESVLAQQDQALERGYATSADIFNKDASRQGALTGTLGQLNLGEQRNIADIGQTRGALTGQQMGLLTQLGSQRGNLTSQRADQLSRIGSSIGQLTGQEQSNRANIGQVTGNLTSMGQRNRIDAGNTLANLANLGQGMNLRDAAALESIGATQQNQLQKNYDLAYKDFLEQRDYPKTQLNFLNSMLRGIPYGTTTSSSQTGPASSYSPSPLSQLASAFSLYSAFNRAEGGPVSKKGRRRRRGGRNLPRN